MNVHRYSEARTRAMQAHPAGKALMSDDERQARQDDEACTVGSLNWRINEKHHELSTGPRKRWVEVLTLSLTVVAVFAVLFLDVFVINGPVTA